MLKADKMTIKTQEALVEAQDLAHRMGHGSIEPDHLLIALLSQEGGLVAPILQKIGANTAIIRDKVDGALEKLSKVSGNTQIYISPVLNRLLDAAQKEADTETLKESFKLEFLNRIDEVLIYHALTLERIKQIVDIQIRELEERLAERHIGLTVTDKAREYLAREGYDPAYGARPLKRTLQRKIQDPLALMLLDGKFAEGDTVLVDLSIEKEGLLIS